MRVFGVGILAILLAAVLGFVLAMFWFGPGVYGSGIFDAFNKDLIWAIKQIMGGSALWGFVSQLVACLALSWLLDRMGLRGFFAGMAAGALSAVGFVLTALVANTAWQHGSLDAIVSGAAYAVAFLSLAGGALGASR